MVFAVLQRFSENGDAIEALAQRIVINASNYPITWGRQFPDHIDILRIILIATTCDVRKLSLPSPPARIASPDVECACCPGAWAISLDQYFHHRQTNHLQGNQAAPGGMQEEL
jgi:hypothetical protein